MSAHWAPLSSWGERPVLWSSRMRSRFSAVAWSWGTLSWNQALSAGTSGTSGWGWAGPGITAGRYCETKRKGQRKTGLRGGGQRGPRSQLSCCRRVSAESSEHAHTQGADVDQTVPRRPACSRWLHPAQKKNSSGFRGSVRVRSFGKRNWPQKRSI